MKITGRVAITLPVIMVYIPRIVALVRIDRDNRLINVGSIYLDFIWKLLRAQLMNEITKIITIAMSDGIVIISSNIEK